MSATATPTAQSIDEMLPEEIRDLNKRLGKKVAIKALTHFAIAAIAVVGTILVTNKLENDDTENDDTNTD